MDILPKLFHQHVSFSDTGQKQQQVLHVDNWVTTPEKETHCSMTDLNANKSTSMLDLS